MSGTTSRNATEAVPGKLAAVPDPRTESQTEP